MGFQLARGVGTRDGRPDLVGAANAFQDVIDENKEGNLNATYYLGDLLVRGYITQAQGSNGARLDVAKGTRMKEYAIAHGYSPETDTVRTASNPASGASSDGNLWGILGGIVLGAIAIDAITSSDSPKKTEAETPQAKPYTPPEPPAPVTCMRYRDEQVLNPKGSAYGYITKKVPYMAYGVYCQ